MQVYRNIQTLLVALIFLTGCEGEGTLLDLYPWEPIVNPEVRTLIEDNRIIHAQLGGRNQINGITVNGSFETWDRFKSFGFEPHNWQEEGLLEFGADLIVRAVPHESSFSLLYSRDYGRIWGRYERSIGGSPVKLFVGAENLLWLLCQEQGGVEGNRLLLYRVNLAEGTHELLLRKRNALARTAAAFDAQRGWVLWEDPSTHSGDIHVLKTTDGGHTWSDGATLKNIGSPLIGVVDAHDLLVFGETGTALHSANGGATFEPVVTGLASIQQCQVVTTDVIYVLSVDGRLGKSIDGGLTWTPLITQVGNTVVSGGNLHFQHERRGIVYDADRMFITEDGGEHWDVLIYPYDYVFE